MSFQARSGGLTNDEINELIVLNERWMKLRAKDCDYVKAATHQQRIAELREMLKPSGVRGET
jgi:hypothetical protein